MTSTHYKDFLETATKAASLAGGIIMKNLGKLSREDIKIKMAADFVTRVDKESEEVIIKTIKETFPDHNFLAEESAHQDTDSDYQWIIDPLDGTTNFIHGFPVFSVSIALAHKGDIIAGTVYDPVRQEVFTAQRGKGAFLNGDLIHVSDIPEFSESLVATGFPFRKKEFMDKYLNLFRNIFEMVSDLRRAGSAALDLSYLASGRCDGFFEIGLSPWDIAAGSLLIEEAGGIITDFGGGNDYLKTGNIVAGSPAAHKKILDEVEKVFHGSIDK